MGPGFVGLYLKSITPGGGHFLRKGVAPRQGTQEYYWVVQKKACTNYACRVDVKASSLHG